MSIFINITMDTFLNYKYLGGSPGGPAAKPGDIGGRGKPAPIAPGGGIGGRG